MTSTEPLIVYCAYFVVAACAALLVFAFVDWRDRRRARRAAPAPRVRERELPEFDPAEYVRVQLDCPRLTLVTRDEVSERRARRDRARGIA